LVYLDTESTGLDPWGHHLWEVAYAVEDGPIITIQLEHSLRDADLVALQINRYIDRVEPDVYRRALIATQDSSWAPPMSSPFLDNGSPLTVPERELKRVVRDATIVGQNPEFDRRRLADR